MARSLKATWSVELGGFFPPVDGLAPEPSCATLMPNSTWDLASLRESANDGVDDTAAMHAPKTPTRIFIR
jgi:hypothetical protein